MPTEESPERERVAATADLIRKGATLMGDACPRCGGVQIRYQGKVYCTKEDDLSRILSSPATKTETSAQPRSASSRTLSVSSVASERDALKALLEEKLAKITKELDTCQDLAEQAKLLDLISKYLETLEKLKSNRSVT